MAEKVRDKSQFNLVHHLVAGTAAGMTSTALLYPLDLVRTRFQVHSSSRRAYPTVWSAFQTIAREEGVTGLYRGLASASLGASVSWGLYFFFYEQAKARYQRLRNTPDLKLPAQYHLMSASEAGILCVLFTNPIWLVKTRMQVQGEAFLEARRKAAEISSSKLSSVDKPYRNLRDAFQTILREEGILGLYKGVVPALLLVSHGAIQFLAYEEAKHYMGKYTDNNVGWYHHFLLGGLSKVVASSTTYPYQVIKARLQQGGSAGAAYSGTIDCATKIWRKEGLYGFYKGIVPNILRVAPSSAVTFVCYEQFRKISTSLF